MNLIIYDIVQPTGNHLIRLARHLVSALAFLSPHPLAVFLLLCSSRRGAGNGQGERRKGSKHNNHDAFDEERGQKEVRYMAKTSLLENLCITVI